MATDEQASQGDLSFSHKNDWTWDWGQSQKRGTSAPPGGGRGAVDAETSSKALGKGSLSEATVVSSSHRHALPFLPSLIQTSGSHKELLGAALSGAVRLRSRLESGVRVARRWG